ncbi:MAG: cytochrome-c oxidase, cbb3-type subunit III [Gammaproteobacteria bacterium]
MADMQTGFWAGWIAVLTLVSLAAMGWLVWSIYFGRDSHEETPEEPVWDETLEEGHRPPPLWWFWLLFGAMIFSLIYLIFFPGLGSYSGLLDWSQGARMADSMENFDARFAEPRAEVAAMTLAEIQNDLNLMDTAERIFRRECSVCHGPDGRGQANLFPNLHDVDWQWGASPEQIEQSIRGGRRANMIAWQAVLGEDGIDRVAEYVQVLGSDAAAGHEGATQYQQTCAACHGADGSGNVALGAPRLDDDIWLYGGDLATIRETLQNGRYGVMPAFGERLDDFQIKLLIALLAR